MVKCFYLLERLGCCIELLDGLLEIPNALVGLLFEKIDIGLGSVDCRALFLDEVPDGSATNGRTAGGQGRTARAMTMVTGRFGMAVSLLVIGLLKEPP